MTAADRPSVTDNARVEAERRWPHDDYRDPLMRGAMREKQHAFVAGAEWAAARAETTTDIAEDALDSLPYFTFEDDDVAPDEEFVRKADVARLLATARTRPTREQIIDALVMSPLSDTAGTDMRPFEQTADAVLALLRGGA